jgi:hypothetical protein
LGHKVILGLDLGTTLGVARVFTDGGLDAQTIRLESNIGSRTVGVAGIINRFAGPDCVGVCIEEPFFGQFSSVKALLPMLGATVLACELAGLPWSAIHLARLKIHTTGKGNAKEPDMEAAAKGRRQQQGRRVECTEDDAKRSRANGCEQGEAWRASWRQTVGRFRCGLRSLGRQCAVADLIDHRNDGQNLPMSKPSGLTGTICEIGSPSSSTMSSPQ